MDKISEYQKETNNLNLKLLLAQYDMYRNTLQKMNDRPAKEKIQIGKFKFVKQIMEIIWAVNRTISKINDLDSTKKFELLYVSSDDPNVDNLENHFDEIVNDFYCDEQKEIKDAEEIQIDLDESAPSSLEPEDEVNEVEDVNEAEDAYTEEDEDIETVDKDDSEFELELISDEHIEEVKEEPSPFDAIVTNAVYDMIPLPSDGECYPNKTKRLAVSYLTANDENYLTSPNMYSNGLAIDFLLKKKIVSKDFNIDNLCTGDADAILLWLRVTAYGASFPIEATDPLTNQKINYDVDLTKLKYKPFRLKGDENGYFDFTMPISQDKIKFKFLTRKDKKDIDFKNTIDNDNMKVLEIQRHINFLSRAINNDNNISEAEKKKLIESIDSFNEWTKRPSKICFSHAITNQLETVIMSVNGNTDRQYIKEYIKSIKAGDTNAFFKYWTENEPGVNLVVEVERPASLGGGSFETFLPFDDFVFLNKP